MHYVRTIVRNDIDGPREIDEHPTLVTRAVDCLGDVSGEEGLFDSPTEQIPAPRRLIRGLVVDAVLNADGAIREFRIGWTS